MWRLSSSQGLRQNRKSRSTKNMICHHFDRSWRGKNPEQMCTNVHIKKKKNLVLDNNDQLLAITDTVVNIDQAERVLSSTPF